MIKIVDSFLSGSEFVELSEYAQSCPYSQQQVSDVFGDLSDLRFSHHFNMETFVQSAIAKRIKGYLPDHVITSAYINASSNNTVTKTHTDSFVPTDKTLLLYLNSRWERDWAGQTCFFENVNSDEVVKAVSPKPNKAIIFDASIWHLACPASKLAPTRYTLAVKLSES